MTLTTNYGLDKSKWGHQVIDDDLDRIAANLDLIDAAIKAREDEIDALDSRIDTLDSTHEGALLLE